MSRLAAGLASSHSSSGSSAREPIRIGVIGGGMMAQIAHIPFYRDDPRCRLIAIAEPRPSLQVPLDALAGPGVVLVPTHEALLARGDIDAIVLIAPRLAAPPLVHAVLTSGRHLLVEKPLAHTLDDAETLVALAQANNLLLAVGYMKRSDPALHAARSVFQNVCASGELGAILTARVTHFAKSTIYPPPAHARPTESRALRLSEGQKQPAGIPAAQSELYGWFVNACSHTINVMTYFFEGSWSIRWTEASPPDALRALLRVNETAVELSVARAQGATWREELEVIFQRGRFHLSLPSPMDQHGCARWNLEKPDGAQTGPHPKIGEWAFASQARRFLDALMEGKRFPCTGRDTLTDIALIEGLFARANARPYVVTRTPFPVRTIP